MELTRTAALAIFTGLGMVAADKWNAKRMAQKLAKADEMVDDDTKLENKEANKNLTEVLKAIAKGEEIVVKDDAPAAAPATEAKPTAKGKKEEKAEPAKEEKKAEEKAPAADAKKAEKKKDEKPKTATTPGVRETETRPYLAGVIIAKHGFEAGVTDAMAKEVDEAYGDKNPRESRFCLRNAWHAVRGYQAQVKAHKAAAKS